MTAITAEHIHAATLAWDRARLYDDRIGQADKLRLTAWAEALASIESAGNEAADTVSDWYLAGGRDRPIQVGDIITGIRATRRREIEREHAEQITGGPTVPVDPQLGLPIAGADGEPVWTAYEQHGAIDLTCRTCNAQPDEACVNKNTGMTRKIPCVARLADGHNSASRRSAQR